MAWNGAGELLDGVAGWSGEGASIAPAIARGDSFVVRMKPPRAGTFIYHVHNEHGDELAAGLYGALLVLEPGQRYDTSRDLVFVIADTGPGVVFGTGTRQFINGTASPPPLELVAGEKYRLRFIHITANDGQTVTLSGPRKLEWRALARDGADYSPELATDHPAVQSSGPGTTLDFEFVPPEPGAYELRVEPIPPGPPDGATVVPICVRSP